MKSKSKRQGGPVKAVGYIRVSTADQADNGVSLDAQREKIAAYATFKGFDLVEIVVDAGVSAGKPLQEREGGARVLELTRPEGPCTAVVAAKLDRLFRDAADCLNMSRRWDDAEVGLHLIDMGIDTRSAMGRAFLTMAAGFAELERNLIGERTKAGLEQVVREGGKIGRDPYGWQRSEQKDSMGRFLLVPVESEQAVIRRIVEQYEAGRGFVAIARDLNTDNVPTKRGGEWRDNTVRQIHQMEMARRDGGAE
jgi:DNA invertase Pin-like site-specific DNA recombinase